MKNFRKYILFVFVFTTLIMAFTIFSNAKAEETTYIAAENCYENTYAKAYITQGINIQYSDGTKKRVNDPDEMLWEFSQKTVKFFLRGSTLYYSVSIIDSDLPTEIHQFKKDGTDTIIAKGKFGNIVGGYGKDIITINKRTLDVFRIHNGTATKLFTAPKVDYKYSRTGQNVHVYIFGGKLYDHKTVYDLDTGKTSTFTATSIITTKKYMYYTSGVGNLVMMDLNGKKTYLDKKVSEVIGGNTNKNSVYIKNDTIYRISSTGKIYKLTTFKELKALMQSTIYIYGGPADIANFDVVQAVFVNGKVYIAAYGYEEGILAYVNNTGGKLIYADTIDSILGGWNVSGNTIFLTTCYESGGSFHGYGFYNTSVKK